VLFCCRESARNYTRRVSNFAEISQTHSQLLAWSSEASRIVGDIFDEASRRFTEECFPNRNEGVTLWQLQASSHTSGESVLLLVGNVRLWDADVLVRSVVEGSLKFTFLLIGDETERKQKLHEFADVLFEMSALKRNSRLEEILKVLQDPNADEWRPFREMLLSPGSIAALKTKYPRDVRRAVEQRWSFGAICSALRRSGTPGLSQLGHMMFNYGMSSHIAHQDSVGIGMVWERNGRSQERRDAVELAHGARLITDVCMMSWLRARMLFTRCNLDVSLLKPLYERVNDLHRRTKPAMIHFDSVEYGHSPD
jgi:hypothetical protein